MVISIMEFKVGHGIRTNDYPTISATAVSWVTRGTVLAFGSGLTAAMVLAVAAAAQPYDDRALIRQLGFVAGQAVICRLDPPEVASLVMRRTADAWGYGDVDTLALLDETSR